MTEKLSKWNLEKTKIKKVLVIYFFIFFIIVSFVAGYIWGNFNDKKISSISDLYQNEDFFASDDLPEVFNSKLLKAVWSSIKDDYVDNQDIDSQKLYYGAIAGFVSGLGDPFTTFFTPEESTQFTETISGEFEGIGAEIGIKDGWLTIITPLSGSPAETAGLMSGDIITAIDGLETIDMTVESAVKLIRGEKNTVVTLTIARENQELKDVAVTRNTIELKSVEWEFIDNYAYLNLMSFHEDTDSLIDTFIKEYKASGAQGIIVDLRSNPGGLLTSANYVTSQWLRDSDLIVSEVFGDGKQVSYNAKKDGKLLDVPTVVLIEEGSASGAEILAGALKDHKYATLVGQTTFGKGSVQELRNMPDGSSLKLTVAKWLTPLGNSINQIGVDPDIFVDYTYDQYIAGEDPQLDKAVEILFNQDSF